MKFTVLTFLSACVTLLTDPYYVSMKLRNDNEGNARLHVFTRPDQIEAQGNFSRPSSVLRRERPQPLTVNTCKTP